MLLHRLATGATGVKQARYRRGPTRGSEALYALYSNPATLYIMWSVVFSCGSIAFLCGKLTMYPLYIGAVACYYWRHTQPKKEML